MPRFDFECRECGLVFEAELPLHATDAQVTCPRGHCQVRKRFSPPAIVFKGSGWYVTDSRKPAGTRESSA
jgi:putative FmdB family regulatory protein